MKESWFESLDTSVAPTRNADGSINMHGLLLLTAEGLAATDAGARGSAWGQPEAAKATIWVVGDSTVSAFDDSYYLPREGYGEEIANYFNADVYNLGCLRCVQQGLYRHEQLQYPDERFRYRSGSGRRFRRQVPHHRLRPQ